MNQRFDTLEGFYTADERRRRSGEVDFGVWWTLPNSHVTWRVSWVADTGELYAVASHHTGGRELGPVRLCGVFPTRQLVEEVLEGWAERCGPGGLAWLQRICAAASVTPLRRTQGVGGTPSVTGFNFAGNTFGDTPSAGDPS